MHLVGPTAFLESIRKARQAQAIPGACGSMKSRKRAISCSALNNEAFEVGLSFRPCKERQHQQLASIHARSLPARKHLATLPGTNSQNPKPEAPLSALDNLAKPLMDRPKTVADRGICFLLRWSSDA